MSNFEFIRDEWPHMFEDCRSAESHLSSDPVAACIYARRATERVVQYLYDLIGIPLPYRDDLSARINDVTFKARVGNPITEKLNLIRKIGNQAAHANNQVPQATANNVLRELYHVIIWAAYHYSTHPQDVPSGTQFDPAKAKAAQPLTREQVKQLAQKFKEQDQRLRASISENETLAAQLAALREEVAIAQASNTAHDTHDYDEAHTRDVFIDLLLGEAGWTLGEERDREYPVTGMPTGPGNTSGTGYVDYVLWGKDGLPLAIVEAKRTRKSPQTGQQQAKLYADSLEQQFGRRPVIFYTNGYEHWLWDDAAGYPPREVQGFYTRNELELLIHRRHSRAELSATPVNNETVNRAYQKRAILAVGSAFTNKQREALLVMATGAGKTRTVIALVEHLMKANWVKRVLFLADRTALVKQAAGQFTQHLPNATTVNLVTEKDATGAVYVSTYPTMMNLINEMDAAADPSDNNSIAARRFGPGYFDLVIIDEAHRSVYQKYGAIFDWFDSLLVGLTATPIDEIDRNTYRLFKLEDGVPTEAYALDDAIKDGYLVPPSCVSVGTKFLRQGIRYDQLSDHEKDAWDTLDWGDGDWNSGGERGTERGTPDEVSTEELNRFLFNKDTVDKVLETLMTQGHNVESGDRLGKTIIFAKNTEHAEFIQERFDANYPEYGGTFSRVITHNISYAQSLIEGFSQSDEEPHIAISVDMLDTGIDVPEVVNLVLFKAVRSKSKFWQMIGRGTRLSPDLFGPGRDKKDFLVFDFCGNFEFFNETPVIAEARAQKSLNQRLFDARLGLVTGLDRNGADKGLRASAVSDLHRLVEGMNLDNFLVRPQRKWVEQFREADAWLTITPETAATISAHLSALPSAATDNDENAKRFDMLMLRAQLARLDGDDVAYNRIREQVQNISESLLTQTAIPTVEAQAELLESVAGEEWWVDTPLSLLELARIRLRGLFGFLERTMKNRVYTDFEDELDEATSVTLRGTTVGTNMERFRAKAAAYLREHEDHLALQRLRRNKQLTPEDLESLEGMLASSGLATHTDLATAADASGGLGLFIRSLVGLDRHAATQAFGVFLDGSRYTVEQVHFVNMIVEELTAAGIVQPRRLFETPFTDNAPTGPTSLFPDHEVNAIVSILDEVKGRAVVAGDDGTASRDAS